MSSVSNTSDLSIRSQDGSKARPPLNTNTASEAEHSSASTSPRDTESSGKTNSTQPTSPADSANCGIGLSYKGRPGHLDVTGGHTVSKEDLQKYEIVSLHGVTLHFYDVNIRSKDNSTILTKLESELRQRAVASLSRCTDHGEIFKASKTQVAATRDTLQDTKIYIKASSTKDAKYDSAYHAHRPNEACNTDCGTLSELRDAEDHTSSSSDDDKTSDQSSDRTYEITFSKILAVDLASKQQLLDLSAKHEPMVLRAITAMVQKRLTEHIKPALPRLQNANQLFLDSERLSCGVLLTTGFQVEFQNNPASAEVELVWKSCKGHFFPQDLLSDFLLDFCGSTACRDPGSQMIQKAAKILKGIRIAVATGSVSRRHFYTITGLESSARISPQALHRTASKSTLESLRHPDMVCVNVSTKVDKPFYFPAELCKILPDQHFRGELPVHAQSAVFHKPAQKAAVEPRKKANVTNKPTDRFSNIVASKVKLAFVEVLDATSGNVQPRLTVHPAAWKQFQSQLGERLDGKLRDQVAAAASATVQHSSINQDWLGQIEQLLDEDRGIHRVLVVAVPKSLPKTAVEQLKHYCDVKLGVQCNIVAANEVNKHFSEHRPEQMFRYTGSVVRKMLARTALPGSGNTTGDATGLQKQAGVLVGVHITHLKDLFPAGTEEHGLARAAEANVNEIGKHSLLTIVSADSSSDRAVKEQHKIITITTAQNLSKCTTRMLGPASECATEVLVYQHSRDLQAADILKQQAKALHGRNPSKLPNKKVQIVTFSQESLVGLPEQPSNGSSNETEASSAPLADGALTPIFSRSQMATHAPQTPWLINTALATSIEGVTMETVDTSLESRVIPDILYLAEQASKRARLRLRIVDNETGKREKNEDRKFDVGKVHKALEGSLYFL